jgi:hypothetical protein
MAPTNATTGYLLVPVSTGKPDAAPPNVPGYASLCFDEDGVLWIGLSGGWQKLAYTS